MYRCRPIRWLAILSTALVAGAVLAAPLAIDAGLIEGASSTDGKIRIYRGIPYAAAPVGELRWRPPAPVARWQGIRAATEFSAACVQPTFSNERLLIDVSFSTYQAKFDEDCLYLNVWAPATAAKARLPVMLWIHGGGLYVGYGHQPVLDGEMLARKDVVVVTINYRLGPLGFLALPELSSESSHHASGNYGLMDQIAALQWVQKNIVAFGGDPSNVTIFGQSGGAHCVSALIASPLARDLFHKAIGQSGAAFGGDRPMLRLAQAEQNGLKFLRALNASSVQALRHKTATEIVAAATDRGQLIVDGWVLPEDVDTVFARGTQHDVPLLTGFNADEGSIYGRPGDPADYVAQARKRYGVDADAYLRFYPATTTAEVRTANNAALRDYWISWGNWRWAHEQKRSGKSPVYFYYFDRAVPLPNKTYAEWPDKAAHFGAFHSAELPYVFDTLSVHHWPWQAVDHRLAAIMTSYWTNFARTGSPNGAGLPHWPVFDTAQDRVMYLGQKIAPGPVARRQQLEFFDAVFSHDRAVQKIE